MPHPLWAIFARKPILALTAACLLLSGCANFPGGCGIGIAHEDCAPVGSAANQFPSDDAICRSYGFVPGGRDYARCRAAKASVQGETKALINAEWWKNPL
jgi:hypothetical protein